MSSRRQSWAFGMVARLWRGVWVAHPDVNEPEQVIIRNLENNKSVVGALFLRARNIPGPPDPDQL